jgi:hypothetical protein
MLPSEPITENSPRRRTICIPILILTKYQLLELQGGERGFNALTQFFEKVISVNRNGGEGRFPKEVAGRGGSASQR